MTMADCQLWGRFVESTVGAHLANAAALGAIELFYWRDRNREVEFVARAGKRVVAIEVKGGRSRDALPGLGAFLAAFGRARPLLVGADGIPVEEFLARPVAEWMSSGSAGRAPHVGVSGSRR